MCGKHNANGVQPSLNQRKSSKVGRFEVLSALLDFSFILSMVLGGCCTNVWTYEEILNLNPGIGSALTFSQMLFVTLALLPAYITLSPSSTRLIWPLNLPILRLKPCTVPIRQWALQVLVFTSGSLLNNWVFAFDVPVSVIIVFRSGGLAVSMLFGYLFLKKQYSGPQIASVVVVTTGVILATLSRPASAERKLHHHPSAQSSATEYAVSRKYIFGIFMLVISVLLTAWLGVLQERTYRRYGPVWKEGLFYTHLLSLPIFIPLSKDVIHGFRSLVSSPRISRSPIPPSDHFTPYLYLACNLVTQYFCVAGVNRLTSRVSSVSTNLVLTARKALSLCFSVWWFGSGWTPGLEAGACMVFVGSLIFGLVGSGGKTELKDKDDSDTGRQKVHDGRGLQEVLVKEAEWNSSGTETDIGLREDIRRRIK